jgi:hypothetical protein
MPHEIKVGDVYQTRDGSPARIIATDRKDPVCPIVALVGIRGEEEIVQSYTRSGGFPRTNPVQCRLDLILSECYDDWEIDDKIWVWDDHTVAALPRHFAGSDEDGRVLAWPDGETSHSAVSQNRTPWQYASKTKP